MTDNSVDAIFTVDNVIFKSEQSNFCIIKGKSVKIEKGEDKIVDSYIFRGNFRAVNCGDRFKANCNWIYNKHGWQLDVAYSNQEIPCEKYTRYRSCLCQKYRGHIWFRHF